MFTARCDKPQVRPASLVCRGKLTSCPCREKFPQLSADDAEPAPFSRRPRRVIKRDTDSHRGSHRPLTWANTAPQEARTAPRRAPQGAAGHASRGSGCQAARGPLRAAGSSSAGPSGRRIFWARRASLSPVTTHRSDVCREPPSSPPVGRPGVLRGGRCGRGVALASRVPGGCGPVPGLHRRAVPGRHAAPTPPAAPLAEESSATPPGSPNIFFTPRGAEPKNLHLCPGQLVLRARLSCVMPGQRDDTRHYLVIIRS
jgi:hypothetical protein